MVFYSLNPASALAMLALGRWPESEAVAEAARQHFAALGNRVLEADSLTVVAQARIHRGQPRERIRAARAAYAISREIANAWGEVSAAIQLAEGLLEIGEYGQALALAREAATTARTHAVPMMLSMSPMTLGAVQRSLRALAEARATHEEAMAVNASLRSPPTEPRAIPIRTTLPSLLSRAMGATSRLPLVPSPSSRATSTVPTISFSTTGRAARRYASPSHTMATNLLASRAARSTRSSPPTAASSPSAPSWVTSSPTIPSTGPRRSSSTGAATKPGKGCSP